MGPEFPQRIKSSFYNMFLEVSRAPNFLKECHPHFNNLLEVSWGPSFLKESYLHFTISVLEESWGPSFLKFVYPHFTIVCLESYRRVTIVCLGQVGAQVSSINLSSFYKNFLRGSWGPSFLKESLHHFTIMFLRKVGARVSSKRFIAI